MRAGTLQNVAFCFLFEKFLIEKVSVSTPSEKMGLLVVLHCIIDQAHCHSSCTVLWRL
jgi:hypothetical protein